MFLVTGCLAAEGLEEELGRSQVRVRAAPFPLLPLGGEETVRGLRIPQRLEALGYRRVHRRPEGVGEFFWGNRVFWIWRRPFRHRGEDEPAALLRITLDPRDGSLREVLLQRGDRSLVARPEQARLEPETLAEDREGDRAARLPLTFEEIPEILWRAVLAAEDARFFEHSGLDARGIARALLANIRAGRVEQGGSTITQQLVKTWDLTPKRTLGRKASEAVRALALEAEYDKEEILAAYLNHVYLGHLEGLAIHGVGAGARAWFSRPVGELDLAQAAALAAMIQGPNRLTPHRHADDLQERRDWILGRMEELGWISRARALQARARPVQARLDPPRRPPAPRFLDWVEERFEEDAPRRARKSRGFVAETTLDAELQRLAEDAVAEHLRILRERHSRLAAAPLSAALVALDAGTGDVLAYVGDPHGNPASGFDRVRRARRQPGSTVKPFVLAEAFQDCGDRPPAYPARRVSNAPLRLDLASGPWEPRNPEGSPDPRVVTLREATRASLNRPFVRLARWCGFGATARRFGQVGLALPRDPGPSFVLGAVEVTPLELASAYTALANGGRRMEPRPLVRLERPAGRRLERYRVREERAMDPSTAWLVEDLLADAVRAGTARAVRGVGPRTAAKTGTSSDRRDAWLAGWAGGVVTVVWIGRDDGDPVGLGGATAAAPLWREFMVKAARARPHAYAGRPEGVVRATLHPRTGLRTDRDQRGGITDWFREDALPPRPRWWRNDEPIRPIQ